MSGEIPVSGVLELDEECGSCCAAMVWTVTTKNKRMPVDVAPVDHGNLALSLGADGQLRSYVLGGPLDVPRGDRYISHFATCPAAEKYRRPR